MEETPKKVIQSDLLCFLCGCSLGKDRVRVFGKSSVDIQGLIKSAIDIDLTAYSRSELFVCSPNCYKRLLRFERLSKNFISLKEEIKRDFEKGGLRTKRLRKDSTSQVSLASGPIQSTTTAQQPAESARSGAAKSLKFPRPTTYTSYGQDTINRQVADFSFLDCPPPPSLFLTSTPVSKGINVPSTESSEVGEAAIKVPSVKLSIDYPSKTVNKTLQKEYEAIGKALVYGPPQRVANAVLKCRVLKKHVVENVLKIVSSEVNGLCSRKTPSLLRKSGKDDLVNFEFQSLCEEWQERAPVFFSFLMTSCLSSNKRDVKWLPSAAVAGSVLLKQRNSQMNATASVLGVLVKTGSMEATISRLNKLKVTCSNKCALAKLDVMAADHDRPLKAAKERIEKENEKLKELKEGAAAVAHVCSDTCAKECLVFQASSQANDTLKQQQMACHPGFTIAFDNIDLEINARNMTMSKQNRDVHWVNHKMFINRVSGNSLPSGGPRCDISQVSNYCFLPSVMDQQSQRFNYTILVSRILVEYFDAFEPLKDVCIQHIPHKYSKEMAQKSTKVPLGIIFKDENINEDMLAILRQFQTYLPRNGDGEIDPQLFSGDQLTVERSVNVVASVANGYTPEDRLEGMNFQIGDWHAGVKLLSLIFKRFFSGKSEADCSTLYSDRTLINRRNVKAEPHHAYRADRDFLVLNVQARVIAAAMTELGFTDKSSQPIKLPMPEKFQGKPAKLKYLHKAASLIVDKFVFDDESVNGLLDEISTAQQTQDATDEQPLTADGRFPCRFPGCQYSFKFDGTSRRRHELTHDPPPPIPDNASSSASTPEDSSQPVSPSNKTSSDDVFNYNCALLADGLFFLNFLDAVSEGDGLRLMRQYRYLLLYCKADGQHSNKYALECLYQSFCITSLLSPRDCERFVWNRTVNNKGGRGKNIPHDLEIEHSNFSNKEGIKNTGPNVTEKAVQRISYSESGTKSMSDGVDESINRSYGSGRHVSSSTARDLDELIKRAVQTEVFVRKPFRQYHHFKNFERDPFKNLNMSSLYSWINQHKRNIITGNKAR